MCIPSTTLTRCLSIYLDSFLLLFQSTKIIHTLWLTQPNVTLTCFSVKVEVLAMIPEYPSLHVSNIFAKVSRDTLVVSTTMCSILISLSGCKRLHKVYDILPRWEFPPVASKNALPHISARVSEWVSEWRGDITTLWPWTMYLTAFEWGTHVSFHSLRLAYARTRLSDWSKIMSVSIH